MGSHERDPSSPKRAPPPSRSNSTVSSKHSIARQGSESWEVVEELRIPSGAVQEPERQEGYLLKKRKWPLKGWHKRYFVLEDGILKYATTRQDVIKGKLHGSIDVRLSVMSVNKKAQRVDLDTEENIYHLKIKSPELFNNWVAKLCSHRQVEKMDASQRQFPMGGHGGRVPHLAQACGSRHRVLMSESAPALSSLASSQDKVHSWLSDSKGLDRCSAELSECQGKLQELNQMLQSLESLHHIPSAPLISTSQTSAGTERPRKGKRSTRIWCTQSFAKDDTIGRQVGRLHGSVPNLSRYLESCQNQAIFSLPPEYSQLQRSFWILAQKVHGSLSSVLAVLAAERDRLQELQRTLALQRSSTLSAQGGRGGSIRTAAVGTLDNPECIRRFHSLSISSDTTLDSFASFNPDEPNTLLVKSQEQQLSNRSIVSLSDSHTEFFDACEVFLSASSSENELYMAAFAVSAYASTYYRAGSKPFNPVLGETYECVRPDKGFRFISEQVCHHPPVSACHAESDNFVFWQDMKWKNKFWGKSLEIIPVGTVNVRLPRFGDHYEWNKVTSCIHNILSGQRWIEHYGEVLIRNTRDSTYHCKLTFCKARYWGSGVNEVQGAILSYSGKVIHRLFGKWHDGLYRGVAPVGKCIWRPNPMPRDFEKNYGFTQFALELNELTLELKRLLPSTDTRMRPDQRYLEEGNVQAAESQKRRIEQLQRDRRRVMEDNNILHQARFFRRQVDANGKESWISNSTYWKLRAEPGFSNMDSAVLW
ncbi:oxysterol-binding protein-related protein 7 isoform X3 [Hemicordylus capensis]|uniref:oxysterol-binding protein-related protein 7 isoform X3 n=1 Tax=Hemicordylus capensis TaxID=884348 RepID=UPI002303E6D0|nr:oxysterol-binding protein-related protein 7 isoform X3 [Hemicordylus capensis]